MKPIGQTFFVNEPPPPNGVEGVFITKVGVYFKSKSSNLGIELQIRPTEGRFPTASRLPFATKILQASEVSVSDDASSETVFEFDTPVFVKSNDLYALVLVPVGGNPDYNVWTARISDTDVTTNSPIYVNNSTGDLFLSSNDLSWTPVYNEDMKYNVYIANFTATEGHAVFKSPDEEWITYRDPIGTFIPRELVVFGSPPIQTVSFNISNLNGTFSNGDIVYQSNSTQIVKGKVYSANSTVIKVANSSGAWANTSNSTTMLLFNANAVANCYVNVVSQYNLTTSGNTTVIVPDSSRFTANKLIYVETNNRSTALVRKVASITNTTAIVLDTAPTFTDNTATLGELISNGAMSGRFTGGSLLNGKYYGVLDYSTANSTVNMIDTEFANCRMIGTSSNASAILDYVYNAPYDTLTPHFLTSIPSNTSADFSLKGFHKDVNFTSDVDWIAIQNGEVNEFTDFARVAMSRSNELTALPVFRLGNSSLNIDIHMTTANTKISPVVDLLRKTATLTYNILRTEDEINGYDLNYVTTGPVSTIANGETITITAFGNTTTGTVFSGNSTLLTVYDVNGCFTNTTFTASGGATGYITAANKYGEALNKTLFYSSRYISKNVILTEDQDSEDIRTYLTAYRPSGSNLFVYAKVINSADNDKFDDKAWTRLTELSNPALTSSIVNRDDLVELQYGFATSALRFSANAVANSTNTTVSMTTTEGLSNNSFIYIRSNDAANTFNVREIIYVVNSTAVTVDRAPSFSATNAAIGVIPTIESTTSAFLYDENYNIVRYCSNSDVVYDRYIQFAMKIVPVGTNSLIPPRCGDVRTLALQV